MNIWIALLGISVALFMILFAVAAGRVGAEYDRDVNKEFFHD